ncbi:MAG: T9SS type A sorting domain-containing protein, partial [Prevotella sp.]
PLNCPVFNTGEKRLAGLTAIHAIADQQAEKASLKLEGNHLIASGGYQIAGVYDMAGRQVSENNLGKGIYLVKLSNGKDTQTVKFNIR